VKKLSKCKVYTLPMKKDSSWEITLRSKHFDAFLRMEDSTGKELAYDDDSGGGVDARLIFKAPKDDTYRIIATSFDAEYGPFTLTAEPAKAKSAQEVSLQAAAAAQAQGEKGDD